MKRVGHLSVAWARRPETIAAADIVILPGSKHVAADLAWLRERGLDRAIEAHAAADKPLLAICGGLQMLGRELRDPHGVEGEALGLGLLPYSTHFQAAKQYRHESYTLGSLSGYWTRLSGVAFGGYEIRHGTTMPDGAALDGAAHGAAAMRTALAANRGWQHGQTLALYPHGLFESSDVMRALFGRAAPTLEDTLNGLADFAGAHFAEGALLGLVD